MAAITFVIIPMTLGEARYVGRTSIYVLTMTGFTILRICREVTPVLRIISPSRGMVGARIGFISRQAVFNRGCTSIQEKYNYWKEYEENGQLFCVRSFHHSYPPLGAKSHALSKGVARC